MIDYLTSSLFLLIIVAPFAVFALQIQRVRSGVQSWAKATLWFVIFAICPVFAYALFIVALIGLEELTGFALTSEEIARTFIFILAIGVGEVILLSVLFSIFSFYFRRGS